MRGLDDNIIRGFFLKYDKTSKISFKKSQPSTERVLKNMQHYQFVTILHDF